MSRKSISDGSCSDTTLAVSLGDDKRFKFDPTHREVIYSLLHGTEVESISRQSAWSRRKTLLKHKLLRKKNGLWELTGKGRIYLKKLAELENEIDERESSSDGSDIMSNIPDRTSDGSTPRKLFRLHNTVVSTRYIRDEASLTMSDAQWQRYVKKYLFDKQNFGSLRYSAQAKTWVANLSSNYEFKQLTLEGYCNFRLTPTGLTFYLNDIFAETIEDAVFKFLNILDEIIRRTERLLKVVIQRVNDVNFVVKKQHLGEVNSVFAEFFRENFSSTHEVIRDSQGEVRFRIDDSLIFDQFGRRARGELDAEHPVHNLDDLQLLTRLQRDLGGRQKTKRLLSDVAEARLNPWGVQQKVDKFDYQLERLNLYLDKHLGVFLSLDRVLPEFVRVIEEFKKLLTRKNTSDLDLETNLEEEEKPDWNRWV